MNDPLPQTVVLDVDGTLVDTVYLHVRAWRRAFAHVGLDVPSHAIHTAIGMGGDRLVPHVTSDATESAVGETIREQHREAFMASIDEVRPTRGAAELVQELRQRGYEVVVASSADAAMTDDLLSIAGVDGLVSSVTTGDDVESSKPHPEPVETALGRSQGAGLLMLGDAPWDAHAARDAGIRCVGVLTGGFGEAALREAGMVAVHEDPQSVLEAWDSLR